MSNYCNNNVSFMAHHLCISGCSKSIRGCFSNVFQDLKPKKQLLGSASSAFKSINKVRICSKFIQPVSEVPVVACLTISEVVAL